MWYQQLTKREFIELLLGQSVVFRATQAKEITNAQRSGLSADSVVAVWEEEPVAGSRLPSLLVVTDDASRRDFYALVNSGSHTSLPFSSFCRMITGTELTAYLEVPDAAEARLVNAFIALSYTEALIHGARQIKPAEVSVAMCRRTLSLTWATALRRGAPFKALPHLTDAWLECYEMLSGQERVGGVPGTVAALYPVLSMAASLYGDEGSNDKIGNLCRALLKGSRNDLEVAWQELAGVWATGTSLTTLGDSTREVRADFLQKLLDAYRHGDIGGANDESAAVVAFVANQIAPGSLEHLPLLGERGSVSVMMWYSLFAALIRPEAGLSFNGGVGRRVFRDIDGEGGLYKTPACDISYEELNVVRRGGLDSISRKLGHTGEISIELIPRVEGIFRFSAKQSRPQSDLFEAPKIVERDLSDQARERISLAIHALQAVLESPAEPTGGGLKFPKPRAKKRS